ncbi:MAG TPA: anthranilate synthase component I family protein [Nitrospira sp.]|nr:anthranilate synthase component I family protein [Nitrospira sp.]
MAPSNLLRSSHSSFLTGPPQPLLVTLESRGHENPLDLYARIASPSHPSFLLESGRCDPGSHARYSFLGSNPAKVVSHDSYSHDPFAPLKQEIGGQYIQSPAGFPPFFGGAVGYFSYDFARRFETPLSGPAGDLGIPDFQFGFFDVIIAIDHLVGRTHMIYCPSIDRFLSEPRDKLYREGLDRLAECEARLTSTGDSKATRVHPISFAPEQDREAYLDRVRHCQDYIRAGDIYQANLSHRFSFSIPDACRHGTERLQYEQCLYHQLQTINPSPFSGLLHFGDVSLISCSPERLVRLRGRRTDTRPIAGTRPRGLNAADDRRLVGELLANEKERAEHVMLIDLERNDLGRVCEFGSVHVDEFMAIEQYSHVSHIVSNVSGRLRPDVTPFDLIQAVFPGGTITGVPKIRCMAIIDELEPVRRGPYTGSFGYIGWNGDLDLNIIIRTLVMTKERGYLQVGAGIVADSNPAREYEETLHKAEAFFRSFQG